MRNRMPIEDAELWKRSRQTDPIRVETHEVRYLDLTGDGIPDAVEHVTRRAFRAHRSDTADTVEETRRLEHGIGFDGKPSGVTERTSVFTRDRFGTLIPKIPATAEIA